MSTETNTCQYCNKSFVKPTTLFVHVCEKKRRALAQHDKNVVVGFDTYRKFFLLNQKNKRVMDYQEFSSSPYYNAFVKFGSFVSNVNPLYPDNFIDYVIKSGVKLDHWCRDELYDKYVVELLKSENVETALNRSVNHMVIWADKHNTRWNDYFLSASISRITYDIKDGKISPWLILHSPSAKTLLRQMTDEQLALITTAIDPQFWMTKFKRNPADVEFVKQIIKESVL